MRISKDFTFKELRLNDIDPLNPSKKLIIQNFTDMVQSFLQPLRNQINRPVIVTSGYRSPVKNKRVGGVQNSLHLGLQGSAVDIKVNGWSPGQLAEYIRNSGLKYDHLIEYLPGSLGYPMGGVHIGWKRGSDRKLYTKTLKTNAII